MTTTPKDNQTRPRLAISMVATSALLAAPIAAGIAAAPALMTSANAAASPSTPSSHRIVHLDARRDVLRFDYPSETSRPAPRDRATDIIKTVVDHRPHRLVVQSRVRQLSRSGYRLMVAEILTSEGKRYELVVDFSTKPIDSRISLRPSGSGQDVKCPGAAWSVNRSVNRVDASIPSSCLGDPGWVRVGLGVVASPRTLKTSWADDSRSRGQVGEHLKLGPRQPRA